MTESLESEIRSPSSPLYPPSRKREGGAGGRALFFLFFFLFSVFSLLAFAPAAQAACSSPAGSAGHVIYNKDYHVPTYCDGTNWKPMGPAGAGGTGCAGVSSTVAVDAVAPSSAGAGVASSTSLSWSHTVGAGTNTLLVVSVAVGQSPDTGYSIASVTYNGVAMTAATGIVHTQGPSQADGFEQLFYLVNPATGSHTVSVTISGGSSDLEGGSISFTGVNQATPLAHITTNASGGTAFSITVTSATGDMVVDAAAAGHDITSSSQTLRWNKNLNPNTGAGDAAASTAAGASSVTMGYTQSVSDEWAMIGADVVAASGTSAEGTLMYNNDYHLYQFCGGTNWQPMGPTSTCSGCAPSSGLVGYWKLDESSGPSSADSSGNGNTGTWTNGPTYTASGKINGALTFAAASSQYVNVPDVASLRIAGSWTVSAWVNLPSIPASGSGYALLSKDDASSNENYALWVDNKHHSNQFGVTGPSFVVHFATTTGFDKVAVYTPASISTNTWYLVTGTWDGTTETLYVNGTSVATNVPGAVPSSATGAPLLIGDDNASGTHYYMNGTLDDARVYNRALSATEIMALYNYTGAGGSGCSSPAGVEGNMFYNSDLSVMEYCNNESWVRISQ